MPDMPRHRADRAKNLVGFRVGDATYAVEILRVREIINPLPVVPLPHAPPSVMGVAEHRGDVMPVVDVRVRFGLASVPSTRRTKWIVVDTEPRSMALVVDAVTDVFSAGAAERRAIPEVKHGRDQRAFSAVYAHDGSLVFVLDVDRLRAVTDQVDFAAIEPQLLGENRA